MKKLIVSLLLLVSFTGCGGGGGGEGSAQTPAVIKTGSLHGRIIDCVTKLPIEGATIKVGNTTTTSLYDGEFYTDFFPCAQKYECIVDASSYALDTVSNILLNPGKNEMGDIQLVKGVGPVVSNIVFTPTPNNSYTVTWKTNKDCESVFIFGDMETRILSSDMGTTHSISAWQLHPGMLLNYSIECIDDRGCVRSTGTFYNKHL